ncbi:Dbl homology domain-containing protein [Blastocladiella britannica]|nr:Dbl homology domain-containing protein [Blastocladiella britannica]
MKQANRLARQRTLAAAATQIQCAWRGVQCRRHLSLRSRATITFQRYARGYLARKASARRRAEGERRAYDAEQRARVIEELLETEASYVRNLDVLVRVYWRPLRSLASVKAIGSQITVESIATIFGNVDILHEKHSEWYDQLAKCLGVAQCDSDAIPATNDAEGPQAKRGSCSTLGEVFLEMLPWLDEYVPFCVNYPLSKAELDRCLKVPSFESYLSVRAIFFFFLFLYL